MAHKDMYKDKSEVLLTSFVIGFDLAKKIFDRMNSIDQFPYNHSLEGFYFETYYYDASKDILYCGYPNTETVYNPFG